MSLTRYVRSFDRYELKYLIRHGMVSDFVRALDGYVYTDPNCNGEGDYPIYSVYCDSPDLSFFWEKIEGIKFRRKVRFRRYGESPEVFLEIKQRVDRTLQKRRVRWPLEKVAHTFCCGDPLDKLEPDGDPVLSEVAFLWHQYRLRPCMAISYRRRAFFALYEPDLRITLDSRVQYHACELDLRQPFETGKYAVDPEFVVMEIKFNDRVPLWLCKEVNRFGLQQVRLSKYCAAVDREFFQGRLT